jgi:NifU-like protein involved in Fe-S cluster formation
MLYKAFIKQKGQGCDYTIACGETIINIKTSNLEEAKKIIANQIKENYTKDHEQELEVCELYEINQTIDIDLEKLYSDIEREKLEVEKNKQDLEERRIYEQLKRKFEK